MEWENLLNETCPKCDEPLEESDNNPNLMVCTGGSNINDLSLADCGFVISKQRMEEIVNNLERNM